MSGANNITQNLSAQRSHTSSFGKKGAIYLLLLIVDPGPRGCLDDQARLALCYSVLLGSRFEFDFFQFLAISCGAVEPFILANSA